MNNFNQKLVTITALNNIKITYNKADLILVDWRGYDSFFFFNLPLTSPFIKFIYLLIAVRTDVVVSVKALINNKIHNKFKWVWILKILILCINLEEFVQKYGTEISYYIHKKREDEFLSLCWFWFLGVQIGEDLQNFYWKCHIGENITSI